MSDIDATRKRHRVADPLRERILRLEELGYQETNPMLIQTLEACADEIDRDHARRMDQARNDMRKATCRYMSRVVEDYKHGRKWQRKEYGCAR